MPVCVRRALFTLAIVACAAHVRDVRAGDKPDDLTVLTADVDGVPPRKILYRYLQAEAQKQFDARRKAAEAVKTPDDLKRRGDALRAKFVEALGGFPEKTPLNARTVGTIDGDGYRVERVIYESRPGHHVTANLYLPAGKGPFPAVLMPCGHSGAGKADASYQRAAVLLARNGVAAMSYDPIGQAERRQIVDDAGKPVIASMTTEHSVVGTSALLVGWSTAGFRVWDGIRSIDYLAGRPEIDATKIGCTGCSGGGTLTSYLMALDDRVAAAAPSCYVTSLERLFATIGPQDAEQNVPGQVAFGMEHADYLTMRAPRPTLICAATRDFFDTQGTWASFREAKRAYTLFGFPERVDIAESDTSHGYPKQHREAMARFMIRWLAGRDEAVTEGAFEPLKTQRLQCTESGQVLVDLKGKSVPDLIAEREKELAAVRARLNEARGKAELLADVRRHLALPAEIKPARRTDAGEVRRDGRTIRKLVFRTEPGVAVPGLLLEPAAPDAAAPLVLYVDGRGKSAAVGAGGAIEAHLKSGRRVLALDLRGTGETAPGVPPKGKPSYLGVDFGEAQLALHLARPLPGQRVFDLLAVIESLAGESPNGFSVVGVGAAGPVGLHAAALDGRIRQAVVDGGIVSWTAVARAPVSHDQLTNVVPGVLQSYDLPDLAAAVAPRSLKMCDLVNASGERVKQEEIEASYRAARDAYRKADAGNRLLLGT